MTDKPTIIHLDQTPQSSLTDDQQAVVDVLTEALDVAMSGNIDSIGIVLCMRGGYAHDVAGSRAGDLALGTLDLLLTIREATKSGGAKRDKASRIIKPGRA